MCTKAKYKPKLMVAKKDIVTFKMVRPFYKTVLFFFKKIDYITAYYIRNFYYKLGTTYISELDPFVPVGDYFESGKGFYSYPYKTILCNAKCIIPKGSKYYLCTDVWTGDVVYHSDQIKIVKIVDFDN